MNEYYFQDNDLFNEPEPKRQNVFLEDKQSSNSPGYEFELCLATNFPFKRDSNTATASSRTWQKEEKEEGEEKEAKGEKSCYPCLFS